MLRRSFLRGAIVSPLLAFFPFIGKWRSRPFTPEEVWGGEGPFEPIPRFFVFIPAKTRATHEELHKIGHSAALEIAAWETAVFNGPDANRQRFCDRRLEYIRGKNPAIYESLLVELDCIRGIGKVEGMTPWSCATWAECSPNNQTCVGTVQASFRQKIGGTSKRYWIGGEQTFYIRQYGENDGESAVYHIDVPELAAMAIEHIDRAEKARPKAQDPYGLYEWCRERIRTRTAIPQLRMSLLQSYPHLCVPPSFPCTRGTLTRVTGPGA